MNNKYDVYNTQVKNILAPLNGITSEKDMETAIAKSGEAIRKLKRDFIYNLDLFEYFGFIETTNSGKFKRIAQVVELKTDSGRMEIKILGDAYPYVKVDDKFINKIATYIEVKRKVKQAPLVKCTSENACSKCNGTGYISAFKHINNGICFKCGGTGEIKK